jgi:adenylosuccinate lyase
MLDFALSRVNGIISNLVVYPKNMLKNMNKLNKLPMSEGLMLALTQKGMPREKAYHIVQRCAMTVWKTGKDFIDVLQKDSEVRKVLKKKEITKILDFKHAIRRTDYIFKKVFK